MPGQFLAARANAVAHLNSTAESALTGEVEIGVDLDCVVCGAKAQVFRHRRWVNNLAGVHNPRRIECGFDFAERLINLRTEHTLNPFTSHQSVAVFATHCATEFHQQISDMLRDRVHLLNIFFLLEINHGTIVQ